MAINFPDAPNTNDTHTVSGVTWTYDGTKWTVNPANGGGATVTTSDSAPGSASDGDLWYDTTTAALYVYYEDGTSNQWVSSYGPAGFSVAVDDLSDVTITSVSNGDILSYNGTAWVNAAAPPADISGSNIGQLSDVTITAASSGEVLRYNGSAWVDAQLAYSDLSGTPTLGTAAATASTDYATAAQGTTADSAVQPGDLATVATSGSYNDLSDKPTIPAAAPVDSVNTQTGAVVLDADDIDDTSTTHKFATAAQLSAADSALQSSDIGVSVQGYNANTVIDASYVATDNNFTNADHSKLDGIAAGAEVNVNADWNAGSGDAQILNKPTLGTAAATASTDYATAAQGSLADSALQSVALNDVTDVTISSAASGEVLRYNGSAWVDAQLSYNDLSDQPSIPPTAPVDSVNTQTGAVVLDTDDVSEGSTNLYSQWDNATGGVNYSGGKVGIGQATPATTLDVNGAYSGNITAASSGAIDCSLSNFFTETVAGAVTFSFTNVPSTRSYSLTLEITYTSGSITWPASVYWPLDTAPTLNTGKTQIIVLFTSDGGTTWRGNALADFTN